MVLRQGQEGYADVSSRHEAPFCSQTSALATAVCRQMWGIPTLTPVNPRCWGGGSYELFRPGILGLSEVNHWGEGITRPSWVPGSRGGFSSVPMWPAKGFIYIEDSCCSGVKLQPMVPTWLQSCFQSHPHRSWGLPSCLHHVPLPLAIQEFPHLGFLSHSPQAPSVVHYKVRILAIPTPGRCEDAIRW